MVIKTAEFIESNTEIAKLPLATLPEYAFIGRSNVGKSSLINMLTNKSKLAKISQTPGKTQCINHFIINGNWYLVDLPGYGFAKTSKTNQHKWQLMIRHYLTKRENLQCVFVLIDSRLEPQRIDLDFINWLGEVGLSFVLVFTKADKQSKSRTQAQIDLFIKKMEETWDEIPPLFITSAQEGFGKEEILSFINGVNDGYVVSDIVEK